MAAVSGRAGVEIQGRASVRQVLHPALEQIVLPGHPPLGQEIPLGHALIEVRQLVGVVGLEGVLQAGDRLEEQVPFLRLRQLGQPGHEVRAHPDAQRLRRLGGLVEKGLIPRRDGAQQQAVEGQAQAQEYPQGGQVEELAPLVGQQPPHICPSR